MSKPKRETCDQCGRALTMRNGQLEPTCDGCGNRPDFCDCTRKGDGQPSTETTNQATELYRLAQAHYRLIRDQEGAAWAVLKTGPNIALPIGRGGTFGNHLVRIYYETSGKAPSDDAEKQATKIMLAYLDQQDTEPTYLRVARHGDGIVFDLGTPSGECVVVTADGWKVEDRSSVIFRREACLPLPYPERGDTAAGLAKLAGLVNATDEQFRLAVGWLVAALIPGRGFPILLLRGEQGTAKTTMARMLQTVIDPSGLKPGAMPKDERDFAVRMNGAHVQAFDNVSRIDQWLSDALCRAATGDTYVTRELYTSKGRTVIRYERPIILNTIDAGAMSGDLVERGIPLDLLRIPPEKRRAERALLGDDPVKHPGFWDEFDKHHAAILGAILNLVSAVFRYSPAVKSGTLPRMADFGRILDKLDTAQQWDTGGLFRALVDAETGSLIENSTLGTLLVKYMSDREEWRGTSTEVRNTLGAMLDDASHPPRDWPPDATRTGGQLRRLAPSLRVHGVSIEDYREGKERARTWVIRNLASAASAASATYVDQSEQADAKADARTLADAGGRYENQPASAMNGQASGQITGVADAADAKTVADARTVANGHRSADTDGSDSRGTCAGCGGPLDPGLASAGFTTHGGDCDDMAQKKGARE